MSCGKKVTAVVGMLFVGESIAATCYLSADGDDAANGLTPALQFSKFS